MADVIRLPTAASSPVINPKRRTTPPRNVTKINDLRYRRMRRDEERRAAAAQRSPTTSRIEQAQEARLEQAERLEQAKLYEEAARSLLRRAEKCRQAAGHTPKAPIQLVTGGHRV